MAVNNMTVNEVLKKVYGYDSLREGQEALIGGLLNHRDVVGIMPTGAGKSLCYQIPALMLPGTAIVVSPLISLMADQVRALNQAGIHAAYINSSLNERQIIKVLQLAASGRYQIIYAAPERLLTDSFLRCVRNLEISLLAVDEAHCISQWGQDFRPEYRNISQFIRLLRTRPAIGAFTATATERVREDIIRSLELRQPEVVVSGFDRPNLFFRVTRRRGGRETDNAVIHYVREHSGESGIIYCATRKNVDKLYALLLENGISAARYHAGMDPDERRQSQEDFIFDRRPVMVATNAFGMGIDKSDVRYVLHYNMPQSLEYYYQEAGRAGRDGEYAECVLFYSKQDIMINKNLIQRKSGHEAPENENQEQVYRNRYRKLQRMIDYCETDRCLRRFILGYFGENAPDFCNNCSNCVPVEEAREEDITGRSRKKKIFAGNVLTDEQKRLFEELRSARTELAGSAMVPAYIICSDRTLADMSVKIPENTEQMLDVYGMGTAKADAYGQPFLDAIYRFLHENHLKREDIAGQKIAAPEEKGTPEDSSSAAAPRRKREKIPFSMPEEAWDRFQYADAMKVKDIANQLNELKGDNGTSNITAVQINKILVEKEYLENTIVDQKSVKRVTERGAQIGISEEERRDQKGHTYYAITHSRQSQEKIIELLRSMYTA